MNLTDLGLPVVVGNSGILFPNISGNLPTSISGTNTTAAVAISSGYASDSTVSVELVGAGYSWAVSNGNAINGYSGGTTLPNSSTIHFFLCSGTLGTGTFASNSLMPTFPAGYSSYNRRIFSLNTNSSGALVPGVAFEAEGGSYVFYLTTQVMDYSSTSLSATQVLVTLTVPSGLRVQAISRATANGGSSGLCILLTSGDETNVAAAGAPVNNPPWSAAPGYDQVYDSSAANGTSSVAGGGAYLTTNTSGQIGIIASGGGTASCNIVTRGFKDFRRN